MLLLCSWLIPEHSGSTALQKNFIFTGINCEQYTGNQNFTNQQIMTKQLCWLVKNIYLIYSGTSPFWYLRNEPIILIPSDTAFPADSA